MSGEGRAHGGYDPQWRVECGSAHTAHLYATDCEGQWIERTLCGIDSSDWSNVYAGFSEPYNDVPCSACKKHRDWIDGGEVGPNPAWLPTLPPNPTLDDIRARYKKC